MCNRFEETGHVFETASGWCIRGCGRRDDGRVLGQGGSELKPAMTQQTTTETKETQ